MREQKSGELLLHVLDYRGRDFVMLGRSRWHGGGGKLLVCDVGALIGERGWCPGLSPLALPYGRPGGPGPGSAKGLYMARWNWTQRVGKSWIGAKQERARTRTKNGHDETQMFAVGRLDTIYLIWESPSDNLSRDAGYLRVSS